MCPESHETTVHFAKMARVSLGDVAGAILDAKLPASGAPILSRRKGPERKIEEAKAEEKAQNQIAKAKRALSEQPHRLLKTSAKASHSADPVMETNLRKIATKGVVALFNAVRTAQKDPDEDDNRSGSKKAKRQRKEAAVGAENGAAGDATLNSSSSNSRGPDLSRDSFLDILRRGTAPSKAERAAAAKAERAADRGGGAKPSSGAGFLRDDFMLGRNRAKDWDREVDADEDDFAEDARGVDDDLDDEFD